MKLSRLPEIYSSAVIGSTAREAVKPFDLDPDSSRGFAPYRLPELPQYQIGLIVGSSGSGKSTLLKEFDCEPLDLKWDDRAVADYFSSATEAASRLAAAGLNSVPTWLLRYQELSNGQQFRVELARRIEDNAIIDEFTSVVDRNVAVSASVSVSRYIRSNNLTNVVFATCHRDIIDYLSPDWIIDTDAGELFIGDHKPVAWHKKFIKDGAVGEIIAS